MIDFRVVPDDGEVYEVTATARDVLTWEKTNKGKIFSQFATGASMADMYQLAYLASRRLKLWTDDLKTFESTCEIEILNEDKGEDGADPTSPGP